MIREGILSLDNTIRNVIVYTEIYTGLQFPNFSYGVSNIFCPWIILKDDGLSGHL